jgi:hypothetical protein
MQISNKFDPPSSIASLVRKHVVPNRDPLSN